MKKRFTKLLAAVLGTSLVMTTPLCALAEDPSTTAGTANILAYSVESYVVPTSISIALNPQGYEVKLRDGDNAADKTTSQIVSLNYGIANLSTADKVINLSVAVTGGSEITFVNSADAISTTDAAKEIYLALEANTGDIKTSADAAFAVTAKTGANEHNATAANLTDVIMTADATSAVAFGGESAIKAEKTFELGKATYAVKDGESIDFSTSQEALAGKMEITALGGIKGFTITGAMNTKQDWTKLTAKSLVFTPTYEFIDAAAAQEAADLAEAVATFKTTHADAIALLEDDAEFTGSEEELASINAAITALGNASEAVQEALEEDGITAEALAEAKASSEEAAAAPTTLTATYDSTNTRYQIALPDGVVLSEVSDVTNLKVNDVAISGVATNGTGTVVRINRSTVSSALEDWATTSSLTFTFTIGETNYTSTVAKNG